MVMGLEVFEAHDRERAGALPTISDYARDNDLYLTYVIINPQADRSQERGASRPTRTSTAGIVDADSDGHHRSAAPRCSAPAPSWRTRSW